ncbi:MAG: prepilin-type N-terminal cleavage/methylation domain-containing protein [Candidatus Omnitrophica bacterium]|nr:prepilin-type N-terminal cleavage/methylation domain-containing protein [Candidatus Omnitrophota bacterium]
MNKNDVTCFNRQGFTLIEILLAVMIVVLLAGSLYATFAAGFKLDRYSKQVFRDLDENRTIMEQLHRDFGRAVSYDFRGSFPDKKTFFTDDTTLLFFIDNGKQIRWVRYHLLVPEKDKIIETRLGTVSKRNETVSMFSSTESGLRTLVRDEGDFLSFFDQNVKPDRSEVLSRRMTEKGFVVSCARTIEGQPAIEWRVGWNEDFLPAAVRVNVSFETQEGLIKDFKRDFILPAGGHDEP